MGRRGLGVVGVMKIYGRTSLVSHAEDGVPAWQCHQGFWVLYKNALPECSLPGCATRQAMPAGSAALR